MITRIIDEKLRTLSPSDWADSAYDPLRRLQIDSRGQVGEEVCVAILRGAGYEVDYDANVTRNDSDYDFVCNDCRIEVKLATRGASTHTFQHENLNRQRHFDGMVILDVAPEKVYLLCAAKDDLPWSKMHRRHSSGYWKFDISVRNHEDAGRAIETVEDFLASYRQMENRILQIRSAK